MDNIGAGLRKERPALPEKRLVVWAAAVLPATRGTQESLEGVPHAIAFHLLAPFSLQLVKGQPLTNPAVILENSLSAGAKRLATTEPNTLSTADLGIHRENSSALSLSPFAKGFCLKPQQVTAIST